MRIVVTVIRRSTAWFARPHAGSNSDLELTDLQVQPYGLLRLYYLVPRRARFLIRRKHVVRGLHTQAWARSAICLTAFPASN